MQVNSSSNEKRRAVRHFYATVIRGEVSDATIQGYLRAASQVEDLWQQINAHAGRRFALGCVAKLLPAQPGSGYAGIAEVRSALFSLGREQGESARCCLLSGKHQQRLSKKTYTWQQKGTTP